MIGDRFQSLLAIPRQRIKPYVPRSHQVAAGWNISNSNMAAGAFPGNNVEDYRASTEQPARAITLFDTIIFVTENNGRKPGRNREPGRIH